MLSIDEARQLLNGSPFAPWWGMQVLSVDSATARVRLPVRPEFFRPGGVLQGGCAMTLADVAFWIAAISVVGIADAGVTLEQTSTFLQAARSDLTCDAVVLRSGRSVLYGTASVYDSDDKLVTHHALTYLRSSASPR
jgi:uncharacterized protein (TIGR00369 family)